jgi:adenylosuccinate lyase
MRSGAEGPELLDRLAGDRRIGLGKKALLAILSESARFVGSAPDQVDAFAEEVGPVAKRVKGAAEYRAARLR